MDRYKTILNEARAEQIIEKSRFIAYVKPVETKGEADSFIAAIRAQNKSASHNVPAMVLGEKMQTQWASDDGEPSGTAGAPIVQMLAKEGITNIAVVVTRYFGGIKLGTGGLVRAYTSSAKLGVTAGGICRVKELAVLTLRLDYPFVNKVQSISEREQFDIRDIDYSDAVIMKIAADPSAAGSIKSLLADITAGTCKIVSETEELAKVV